MKLQSTNLKRISHSSEGPRLREAPRTGGEGWMVDDDTLLWEVEVQPPRSRASEAFNIVKDCIKNMFKAAAVART
jgi:hypothetical protein